MSEKQTLEELKKQHVKLKKDLEDVKQELEIVKASISNPKQEKFINNLRDRDQFPKLIKAMLENDAKKRKLMYTSNESTLIQTHRNITGIHIEKSTVEFQPQEEAAHKRYLYTVQASMQGLNFILTYLSNKSPTETKDDETKSELKIVIDNTTLQKEIQDGLDFFFNHADNIQHSIIFLKSVHKLDVMRHKILEKLANEYRQHFSVALSDKNGRFVLQCKGLANPEYNFFLSWQIKFNPATILAKDSFELDASSNVPDEIRQRILGRISAEISDYEKMSLYNYDRKSHLINMAIETFVTADSSDTSSTDKSVE